MVTICLQHIPNNINNKIKIYKDMIYDSMTKTDTYVELSRDDNKLIMPASSAIIVDDESGMKSIKTTGSRKTVALLKEENEDL